MKKERTSNEPQSLPSLPVVPRSVLHDVRWQRLGNFRDPKQALDVQEGATVELRVADH